MTSITGRNRLPSLLPNYVILTLLAMFALIPFAFLVMNSVKSTAEIAKNPLGFPEEIRLSNYPEAYVEGRYASTLANSTFLTVGTIIVTLTLSGMGAFALARLKLRFSDIVSFYFVVGTSVPPQLFMVPLFFMWRNLGLVNSHIGLIIVYCALYSPFATFLLRSYMVAIPEEFAEAARIDGASHWQVMRYVVLPLSWPGFLTAGLVVGLSVWNEFLFALTFLQKTELNQWQRACTSFRSAMHVTGG